MEEQTHFSIYKKGSSFYIPLCTERTHQSITISAWKQNSLRTNNNNSFFMLFVDRKIGRASWVDKYETQKMTQLWLKVSHFGCSIGLATNAKITPCWHLIHPKLRGQCGLKPYFRPGYLLPVVIIGLHDRDLHAADWSEHPLASVTRSKSH